MTDKRTFVCSYVKDQRVMNVLSVLLGVDLKEAAEAQGSDCPSICVCLSVCALVRVMVALISQQPRELVVIRMLIQTLPHLLSRQRLKQASQWILPAQKRSVMKKHK